MQDTIKKIIKWKLHLWTHQQFARHQKKELQTDLSLNTTAYNKRERAQATEVETRRKHTIDTLINS